MSDMNRTRTAVTLAAALATALTLTACGSDDRTSASGTGGTGGSDAELRAAVQNNLKAINDADADAVIAAHTVRCRAIVDKDYLPISLGLIEELYGEITLEELKILQNDGAVARVRGTTGIQALDEDDEDSDGARWVYEDGEWRNDDCDDEDQGDDPEATDDNGQGTAAPGDLAIGDSHTWDGTGLTVTVTDVTERSEFGEWDMPTADSTPFSVHVTIANDGDAPIDLSDVAITVEGATSGGGVNLDYFEGDLELSGRLAVGETITGTWSDSINEDYGRDLVITIAHWHDSNSVWADDPQWLATIK
jgi:hypothetical protein